MYMYIILFSRCGGEENFTVALTAQSQKLFKKSLKYSSSITKYKIM